MELTKINVQQNFFVIQTLMAMFLGIEACKSDAERQKILQDKLQDVVEESYYCLLNNIFLVKFPISAEVSEMDHETRTQEMELFLVKILQKVNHSLYCETERNDSPDCTGLADSANEQLVSRLGIRCTPVIFLMALSSISLLNPNSCYLHSLCDV
nr:adenylate cyclase type 10-like [Chrysemys picta bellii]